MRLTPHSIRIRGLQGIPEIRPGDNLGRIIQTALADCLAREDGAVLPKSASESGPAVPPGSILVVAQKIISKAEGRIVQLDSVKPSAQAIDWASQYHKDERMVEVILRESRRIVRMDRGILIAETHHGFICANAGVDASNAPMGTVVLLPEDPDRSARQLRADLEKALGISLGIIISDTFGRPWRQGLTNVALGVAGLSPFVDYRGKPDYFGRTLQATLLAVADELSGAAELVMGKTLGIPVALVEGFQYSSSEGRGLDLIRPPDEDLFR
ncbi:MAG TPA: coenzyme F420-0:L-glutamate ligase [Acidobacteriota bacterium]|nr:coenzyme F420-0:L-glutamate ligase [Acidobacteriota bacterium]